MRRDWIICAIGITALGAFHYYGVIAPTRRRLAMETTVSELNDRIAAARKAIGEVRALESESARTRARLAKRDGTPALVWFPERMREHFHRFGIEKVSTRVNTNASEPGMRGYERIFWAITLPLGPGAIDLKVALGAIGELEKAEPHLSVMAITVSGGSQSIGGKAAVITASLLTRQL